MSQALPGEHYCAKHQGNSAHYAEHNCTVCKLQRGALTAREALEGAAKLAETSKGYPTEVSKRIRALAASLPQELEAGAVEQLAQARAAVLLEEAVDWPEDFGDENGQYFCSCVSCSRVFTGHKCRVLCKVCAASALPARAQDRSK